MKKMTQVLAIAAMSFGLSSVAMAEKGEPLVVTSGSDGGTYYGVFGKNLTGLLNQRGYRSALIESKGSVHNLERVASGEAHVGFTQSDALGAYLNGSPNAPIEIMGSLGQECMYLAANVDGPVDSEDDLADSSVKIAVGPDGSGSAATWDYMRILEEGYKQAQTDYVGGMRAVSQLISGQYDAFLWVTSPGNLNHEFIRAVVGNDQIDFVDVDDWDLNDELPNGQQVYTFNDDVVVEEGMFNDTEISTACMDVLVIANSNVSDDALEDMATMLVMDKTRITGGIQN